MTSDRPAGVIAIVPARGGSERIPRKAIVDFGGRPLIAWTIEALLESAVCERVLVSTDDREIADVAVAAGAEVPFLREGYADDFTPVSTVTVAMVRELEKRGERVPDTVLHALVTSPLRTAEDVIRALATFRGRGVPFQLSCFAFTGMTPWWARRLDAQGRPTRLFPGPMRRSQDLEPLYCPSGAIWIARTDALLEAGTFYGPDHVMEPLPDWSAGLEIDTYEDLDLAQALLAMRTSRAAEDADA